MINIVMVTRDRDRLTAQALDSLEEHTDPKQFTLTIVDDGSVVSPLDQQLLISPSHYRDYSILAVKNSRHVLGALKNLGVYWSQHHFGRGDWLYLSDNDVYFTEGWADILVRQLKLSEEDGFRLLGGQNHPYHQSYLQPLDKYRGEFVYEYGALAGTSWLMRWETWDKYGPLVETGAPGVGQSEDHEFCQRIREDGFKVGAVYPHVVLDTGITQTGGGLSPGHEAKKKVEGVYYE